jgi:predicted nucleic acid-binding protein
MTAWYVETSAFVKLVSEEAQSDALSRWLDELHWPSDRLVSSDLLRTEARRVARRSTDAGAYARTLERLERVDLLPLSPEVCDDAGVVEPPRLRSLDAIHMVAAQTLGDDLAGIVTYDRRMVEAAALHGIVTVSPGA